MSTHAYRYIAAAYDGSAWLYSGGAIGACRRWTAAGIRPGERVLVAGSGTGAEAVAAARAGARVTAIDASPDMCRRARHRLRRSGVADRVRLLQGDVITGAGDDGEGYDAVIAAFFLNVFGSQRLPRVLAALRRRLAPGGRLITADFAGRRFAQRLYHDIPMHLFARLGANEVHPPHDLSAALVAADLTLCDRRGFRLFGLGPAWIEGLVARWRPV